MNLTSNSTFFSMIVAKLMGWLTGVDCLCMPRFWTSTTPFYRTGLCCSYFAVGEGILPP